MEQINLDNASASQITQALAELGNGDMKKGLKKLELDNYLKGFSKGKLHGLKIALIGILCVGTINACQWVYEKIKEKNQKPTPAIKKINEIIEEEM